MQRKSFEAQYDEVDGGEIVAYASTFYGEPDSYGDVVVPGAFAKTINEWEQSGHPIPLLFGHRTDDPRMNIGAVLEATEDEHGLRIRAKFDEESEIAQYTRKLVKEGRLSKLSFSYDTRDSAVVILEDGRHVRELRDIKLYEISLVPIPANPETEIVEAKGLGLTPEEYRAMREDPVEFYAGDIKTDAADSEAQTEELVDTIESGVEEKGEQVEEKAEQAEEKAPDALADALATIMTLTDRLDSIAEMIDDMAKRIAALSDVRSEEPPADDGNANDNIEAKSNDEADDDAKDNEEDPDEDNSEVKAKMAATLARMARYIRIQD